ncbi:hypothetical protein L208DRAFT_1400543, partial [Tricholoma matsutake]
MVTVFVFETNASGNMPIDHNLLPLQALHLPRGKLSYPNQIVDLVAFLTSS